MMQHGEAGEDERAHLFELPDELHGSLLSFHTAKQVFRDLTSLCSAVRSTVARRRQPR
jgi:hypothetical protein